MRFEFLSDELNDMIEVLDRAKSRLSDWLTRQENTVSKQEKDDLLLQFFREEWKKKFNKEPTQEIIDEALASPYDHPLAKDEDDLDFDEMNDVWDELDELDELDACGE